MRTRRNIFGYKSETQRLRPTELSEDIRVALRSPIFYGPCHTSTTTLATFNELAGQTLFVDAHPADSRQSARVVRQ